MIQSLPHMIQVFRAEGDRVHRVAKVVAPKQQRLQAAEANLEHEMHVLQVKRDELDDVTNKLKLLNDDLQVKLTHKKVPFAIFWRQTLISLHKNTILRGKVIRVSVCTHLFFNFNSD